MLLERCSCAIVRAFAAKEVSRSSLSADAGGLRMIEIRRSQQITFAATISRESEGEHLRSSSGSFAIVSFSMTSKHREKDSNSVDNTSL